jgi:MbtH protein
VFDDPEAIFHVVINGEEQYSIWPVALPVPDGWRTTEFEGTKDACLERIEAEWIDMRPRSLREQMERVES